MRNTSLTIVVYKLKTILNIFHLDLSNLSNFKRSFGPEACDLSSPPKILLLLFVREKWNNYHWFYRSSWLNFYFVVNDLSQFVKNQWKIPIPSPFSETPQMLQKILHDLELERQNVGLSMNLDKTKIMSYGKKSKYQVGKYRTRVRWIVYIFRSNNLIYQ